MNTVNGKLHLWFESEIQPKLKALGELSRATTELHLFDEKKFFNELLADLEIMGLDNYQIENKVEAILSAIDFLKKYEFKIDDPRLVELAFIAFLQNPVDRMLFWNQWRNYSDFQERAGQVNDAIIHDAFRLTFLIAELIRVIEHQSNQLMSDSDKAAV